MKYLKPFHRIDESYLKIHPRLEEFFHYISKNNRIAQILIRMMDNPNAIKSINFLSPSTEMADEVYFSPDSKFQDINVNYFQWKDQKDKIKIGRAIRKILADSHIRATDREVEDFVHLYKSYFTNQNKIKYDVVTGEKIRYWYYCNNYSSSSEGTIGRSCMSYESTQVFLDLYTNNPDVCSLVVMIDSNDKLLARALLWKDMKGVYHLDRIYYTQYWNCLKMTEWIQDWAENNKHKLVDNTLNIAVKLSKWKFNYYPYLDTVRYLNYNKGLLFSSTEHKDSNSEKSPVLTLNSTTGGYSQPHEWVWYKKEDIFIRRHLARWSKEEASYVPVSGFRKLGRHIKNLFEGVDSEMDEILDKINQSGIDSLSPAEKRKLGIIEDLTPKESNIEEIKHILDNIGSVTTQDLEMDSSLVFKDGSGEIHLIERFNAKDVTVVVYGGYKLETEIDDYEVSYDRLDEDMLEDILRRLKQHEEYINWRDEGFPFGH